MPEDDDDEDEEDLMFLHVSTFHTYLHLFCHVYDDLHCSPCTQQPTIKQEMLSVSPVEVQEHRRYVLNMPSKVW